MGMFSALSPCFPPGGNRLKRKSEVAAQTETVVAVVMMTSRGLRVIPALSSPSAMRGQDGLYCSDVQEQVAHRQDSRANTTRTGTTTTTTTTRRMRRLVAEEHIVSSLATATRAAGVGALSANYTGGNILITGVSRVTLESVKITNGLAMRGGGIAIMSTEQVRISRCEIAMNTVSAAASRLGEEPANVLGGGVYIDGTRATVVEKTIMTSNRVEASTTGSARVVAGGAGVAWRSIGIEGASITVSESEVVENRAELFGGCSNCSVRTRREGCISFRGGRVTYQGHWRGRNGLFFSCGGVGLEGRCLQRHDPMRSRYKAAACTCTQAGAAAACRLRIRRSRATLRMRRTDM